MMTHKKCDAQTAPLKHTPLYGPRRAAPDIRFPGTSCALRNEADMQQLCTEILRFLAGDLSCAVVKVKSITERGKSRYDLRVRNSSLVRAKPQAECTRHFRRAVKGGMAYHVYSSRCQRVFKTFK
uniref:Lipocalin n=1 Tax=Rhipicephalus zambeziensis TaxID=60191 RepID=A0A224YER9_9ACAR